MICSRKQGTREFFKMLREKVQPFKLQAEEVSRSSIKYLDLPLTKTGTRFIARPAFKTTSLARPLDPTSAHPKFVHLCSREADVLPCKEELISRLQANSPSKCTIARVVKASPWPERKVPRVSGVSSGLFLVSIQDFRESCLGGASCALVREIWPLFPEIRIAWKNTLPSHHTHVMRCMESVSGGGDGTV